MLGIQLKVGIPLHFFKKKVGNSISELFGFLFQDSFEFNLCHAAKSNDVHVVHCLSLLIWTIYFFFITMIYLPDLSSLLVIL